MTNSSKRARFFYDVVCPYAYLASTQIEALAADVGAEIEWVPMLLGGVFRAHDAPQVPAAHMSPAKARMNGLDLERWSARWGVPFSFSDHHPQRSVEAMRLLCVTSPEQRPRVSKRLFTAYWVEQRRLDSTLLEEVAREFGLEDTWSTRRAEARDQLFANTELAVSFGVFGAPAIEIDGRIFWGQDRLELARRALGGSARFPEPTPAPPGTWIEVFHDFSSPFSYLGCSQVARLARERGVELRWRPMLLGALFKSIDTPLVPLFEMSDAKRAYMGRDLDDWAEYWGVDFTFPNTFPLRTVTALRLAIVAPELTPALYHAAWGEGLDIGDKAVLRAVIEASKDLTSRGSESEGSELEGSESEGSESEGSESEGLDYADALLRRTQEQTVKDILRDNTASAEAQGAFGAPSFVLYRPDESPQLFWGQDRLILLCEALSAP